MTAVAAGPPLAGPDSLSVRLVVAQREIVRLRDLSASYLELIAAARAENDALRAALGLFHEKPAAGVPRSMGP